MLRPDIAYVAIGSNLGDRPANLGLARQAIATLPRTRLLAESSIDETEPLGPVPQGPFLNQMVAIETELSPHELLEHLHAIEQLAGRERTIRWGPRTLDLDIVAYGRQSVHNGELHVPHPELPNRTFWQRELAELTAQ